MQKKFLLSILILLGLNLLFLARLLVLENRSKETGRTIQALEHEKEKADQSQFQPLTSPKSPTPKAQATPSVSELSQDSDIDEKEIQRILRHAKNLQETCDAILASVHSAVAVVRTDPSLYWISVEQNEKHMIRDAQNLASFVGLLDLSSLKPEEADLIHQFVEWRIKASNILYDGDVSVQEKVDVSKALWGNCDNFLRYLSKAIEINYGNALMAYHNLRFEVSSFLRENPPKIVGEHYINQYKVIIPEGYQLEPLPGKE